MLKSLDKRSLLFMTQAVAALLAFGAVMSSVGAANAADIGPSETAASAQPANYFTDVLPGQPFFSDIEWMAASGISNGYANGDSTFSYHPIESVTRQSMAAFLYRLSGERFVAPATPSFSDVPTTNPFFNEIEWMKSQGITNGYADGTFHPLEAVSRQAMAAFLARLGNGDLWTPAAPSFPDVPETNPFYLQIEWMKTEGISTGNADGTYSPLDDVSRQAMAAFLDRYDYRDAGAFMSNPPNVPTSLSLTSPPRTCGSADSPAYVDGRGFLTFQALMTDPDSQNIAAHFFVTSLATGASALSVPWLSETPQAQGFHSVQLPPGTLTPGSYSWRVVGFDGSHYGQTSSLCYVTVDNTP
jgi:hypothetical protein